MSAKSTLSGVALISFFSRAQLSSLNSCSQFLFWKIRQFAFKGRSNVLLLVTRFPSSRNSPLSKCGYCRSVQGPPVLHLRQLFCCNYNSVSSFLPQNRLCEIADHLILCLTYHFRFTLIVTNLSYQPSFGYFEGSPAG